MTSELRELVCLPIASSASRITTSRPAVAKARVTARPTTPAPITTASTRSMEEGALDEEGAETSGRRSQWVAAAGQSHGEIARVAHGANYIGAQFRVGKGLFIPRVFATPKSARLRGLRGRTR